MNLSPDPSLGLAADRIAPLLGRDLGASLESALALAAELSRADVAGALLCRNGRPLVEAWTGREGSLRAAAREVALGGRTGGGSAPPVSPPPPGLPHVAELETLDSLVAVLVLAWEDGRPADLPVHAIARAETVARVVAGRWVRTRALTEVRAERAQQDGWFKTMDQQLRVLDRERQKFVAVVSQSDTFMFVVDPALEIRWVNRAVSRHCEADGIDGPAVTRLDDAWRCLAIDAAPAGSDACPVTRALRTNQVVHEELRRTRGDETQHVYLTFLPIQGPDALAAEVLVMIQDLSGLEVVRRLEARYRRLFEHSPDGMLMIDPEDGRILLANEAAGRLSGYAPGGLRDTNAATLHGDAWPSVRDLCRAALVVADPQSIEGTMTSVTGETITVNLTAVPFDLDGRLVALVQYRDITRHKHLEAELRHSQKMEAVGSLAGGVAHDFNNLLTVILGKSELLASRLADVPDSRVLAETIQKAARRGSLLTRRLLSFSRKDMVRTERLDLAGVVRDMVPLLETLVSERVRLCVSLPAEPCPVHADRGQIEQVLMNLAVNGRDAMPDGGSLYLSMSVARGPVSPVGAERATPRPAARHVMLEVRDEGVGIDENVRHHIFEPFFTTKAMGEGTGLGLSTVYAIVNEAGGRIDVASEPGRGTTFRVLLPSADPGSGADAAAQSSAAIGAPGSERVLLVEDEDDLREMACEALEMGGYAVVAASNGEEALALHAEAPVPFHLLLTDVVMPGIGGGELALRIRETDPAIRVLYMSGYNDDATVRHGVSRDEASFLPKPFTLSQLSGKVRELLDSHPA